MVIALDFQLRAGSLSKPGEKEGGGGMLEKNFMKPKLI